MKILLVLFAALLALLFGTAAALVGPWALVGAVMILPLLMVFYDYRIGVVALTLVMPWSSSPLLPQAQGLSIINYLILFTLVSMMAPKVFRNKPIQWVPKPVIWLYVVPACIGLAVAWPHLPEAVMNFSRSEAGSTFLPAAFVKGRFIKPMFQLIYAMLLANAVADSKKPERFLIALAVSSMLAASVVFSAVALYGGDLTVLQRARNFMSPFGMHANEFGLLIATGCVPLMFLALRAEADKRVFFTFAFLFVLAGLVLTFSRGAWLAFMAGLLVLLVKYRRPLHFLLVGGIIAVVVAAAPEAVYDRLTTGVDEAMSARSGPAAGQVDEFTAGRLGAWKLLAPEVLRSPLIGRGIGSTAWSSPVRDGLYPAQHPHNLYLEVLLDVGIVGFAALALLYAKYWRSFGALSRDEGLSPTLRAYFAGAGAALVALLVMGISNGHYMPAPEQTLFWFSLGMLFGHWKRLPQARKPVDAHGGGPLRQRRFSYLRY